MNDYHSFWDEHTEHTQDIKNQVCIHFSYLVHFATLTETLMEYWKFRRSLMMMEVATQDGLDICFHDQTDDDDVNHDEKTGKCHDDKGSLLVGKLTKLWTSAVASYSSFTFSPHLASTHTG